MLRQAPSPCLQTAMCCTACLEAGSTSTTLRVRPATIADLEAIEPLRQLSARVLTGSYYAEVDIDGALATGSIDIEMIDAGSFFVGSIDKRLVGTAAWSSSTETPGTAVVRSVYVHPDTAGTGVGQKLMDVIERHAIDNGFEHFELQSSLAAVGFYRRLGYRDVEQRLITLNNGVELAVVQMRK